MLIAYLTIDAVVYACFLVAARAAFKASTGSEPWHDIKGFAVVLAGIWAGNNATRPMRLAGAATLAPAIDWILDKAQEKFKVGRIVAAVGLCIAVGVLAVAAIAGYILFMP